MPNPSQSPLRVPSASGQLIEVYSRHSEPGSFSCGFLLRKDRQFVYLHAVTPYGKPDGLLVIRRERIRKIVDNSVYLQSLELLFRHWKKQKGISKLVPETGASMSALLKRMRQRQEPVTLYFSRQYDALTGFLTQVKPSSLEICVLDFYGRETGSWQGPLNRINSLTIQSEEEQRIAILAQHQAQKKRGKI